MRAYELLTDKAKHCHGQYSVGPDGMYTNPTVNPDTGICKAVKWDMIGAIMHCYDAVAARHMYDKAMALMLEMNKANPSRKFNNLAAVNDTTSHEEVIAFLKKVED